jgi:hypothetical protein
MLFSKNFVEPSQASDSMLPKEVAAARRGDRLEFATFVL